ncbi:MAG: hypothetical protein C0618_00500 [Desulfuromonas sp.]|nr:MAG: hypothetical protein C0618_00500 [Desulfuromonas sp.]
MKQILGLLIVLTLLPCMARALPVQSTDSTGPAAAIAEDIFFRGVASYEAADYKQALSLLRNFVLRQHDSPRIPEAYTYLGRIFVAQKRYNDALLYLERIPAEQRDRQAQVLIGFCLVNSGETAAGYQMLLPLAGETTLREDDKTALFSGLALASSRLDKPLQALFFYQHALSGSAPPNDVLQSAHQLLQGDVSENLLAEAAFMFQQSAIGLDARLQQARRALARKDDELARSYLETILSSATPFPYRHEAARLMDRFAPGGWLQGDTIGVLLPLSGRYSQFGDSVKRSMELALELYNTTQPTPLRFLYRDTAGDPQTSRQQTAALTNEERVIAIAGPLTGAASIAAADQAQKDRTPLLSLSQRTNLPAIGDHVFRNSLTSRSQVRALARYAIEQRGLTSFGVLYPENRSGREMADLFIEEVLKYGGLVTDDQSYATDATDFRPQIRKLMGKDPKKKDDTRYRPLTEEEILEDLFVPDLPDYPSTTFDALFIPDYADRVGLIAPQLAFYGIEDIPLLGINGWNSPDLLRLAGKFVQNAVFVDGFFANSHSPLVQEFVEFYRERFDEEPSILEAQAFDVANILLTLVGHPETRTRESVRAALTHLDNYPGVTGPTRFDFIGEAEKPLFLLQVKRQEIVEMN